MLSICRKAGKIALGFDPVESSLYKDAELVLFAKDASKKTIDRMQEKAEDCEVKTIKIDLTQQELSTVLGKEVAVLAILQPGLAKQVKQLSEENGL